MGEGAVNSTTGTTGDTTITGGTTYYGLSLLSAAAVTVNVYNGTSASGELIDVVATVGAAGATYHWFGPNGIRCNNGLFVDGVANTTAYVVYHS